VTDTADVVVVGGGIAGVSVAALLAADRSVLLLEAEPQLTYHTTGRSAAVFLEGYGGPQVRALTRASQPLYEAVPDQDPDATPLLTPTARLLVTDVARAIENVRAATTLQLRSVSASWTGLRTFAPDRVPVAGWDPEVPGLVWLAGQGGFGIQTAPAMAALAAAVIRGAPAPAALQTEGVAPAALSPARFTATQAPSTPPPASNVGRAAREAGSGSPNRLPDDLG
jgi:glycine/D-amino acid oxidase-like deaminating enzyme